MTYETNDLYLSGYLVANGFQLQSHANVSGQTIFRFNQTDELKKLVEKYYNLDGSVNPQRLASALKSLKNIIYQKENKYNYHATTRMSN
jgi:hypothetical protein